MTIQHAGITLSPELVDCYRGQQFDILSLWAVLQFQAANTHAAIGFLSGCASDWKLQIQLMNQRVIAPLDIAFGTRAMFLKSLERLRDAAGELAMVVTGELARRAFADCANRLTGD